MSTLVDRAPGLERAFADEPPTGELAVAEIVGELPRSLRGTYYLNGPARFAAGSVRFANWLDGDGMVVAVRFAAGAVSCRQRFVGTAKLREERAAGRALYRSFGTRFAGDRLVHGVAVASPVNLSPLPFAGKLLAFGEQGLPWALDAATLETVGPHTFDGALNAVTPFAGHPKLDPRSGELVNFGVAFSPAAPALHLFRFAPDGGLALRARQPLPYPASIHDFALGAEHAVFHVSPYLLDLDRLRAGATVLEALSWQPERGSRLLALRRADGAVAADVALPGGYCLHLLNAFVEAGRLSVDLLELDRPVYGDYHGLPDLFVDAPRGRPVRYEVDLASGRLVRHAEIPFDGLPDFVTHDRRRGGMPSADAWLLAFDEPERPGRKFFDRLVHLDWRGGRVVGEWRSPAGTYLAGEPAFAAVATSDMEQGASRDLVVVPLFDAAAARSGIALFAADDVVAGPRAVVWLAARTHLGFHSFFVAA